MDMERGSSSAAMDCTDADLDSIHGISSTVTADASLDASAASATRDKAMRLFVIPRLLDKLIECLDRWNNFNNVPADPTFDDLQDIHAVRNVCTEWREVVDNRVEYHALWQAEKHALLNHEPGWAPYKPTVVSGFLRNVEVLQKKRVGFHGLGQQ